MSEDRLCAWCLCLIFADVNGPDGMMAVGTYGRRRITNLVDLNEVLYGSDDRFESLSGFRVTVFERTQVGGTSVCSRHVRFAMEKAGLLK
jgi:hypothetical protein